MTVDDMPAAGGEDRYEPGVQRDIRAVNRALRKAIMALLRIEKRLEGEDSDRFGHTLDAACIASNSLLIFADGGWGTDAGVVRLYASETDDGDFKHLRALFSDSGTTPDVFACLTCKRIRDALDQALGAVQ